MQPDKLQKLRKIVRGVIGFLPRAASDFVSLGSWTGLEPYQETSCPDKARLHVHRRSW